jgi:hypothetical protein
MEASGLAFLNDTKKSLTPFGNRHKVTERFCTDGPRLSNEVPLPRAVKSESGGGRDVCKPDFGMERLFTAANK